MEETVAALGLSIYYQLNRYGWIKFFMNKNIGGKKASL